jgi:hypothetical protein
MAFDLQPIDCPWTEARPGDVLCLVEHYEELVGAIRRRAAALKFTYLEVDTKSGLPSGYCAKLLGPSRGKNLGPLSLGLMLEALGLQLAVVAKNTPVPFAPRRANQARERKRIDAIGSTILREANL